MSTFDPYGFWIFSITSVVEIEGGSWKIDDLTDGQVERGTERGKGDGKRDILPLSS
jgi:hypothetical protein